MKTKIPPPVIALITGIIMWFVANSPLGMRRPFEYALVVAIVLAVSGFTIASLALSQFRKAETTVNPHKVTEATELVRQGIFSYSRNPMYLGLTFVLLGWATWLTSPVNIVVIVAFVVAITELQIKPEEASLAKLFGSDYEDYRNDVRRWL